MSRLVHLVADYGPGDLAYAGMIQRLALAVPNAVVHVTRVAPTDTVAAGFCTARLALTDGPADRVVANDVGSSSAAGGRLCGARTRDGVWVVGPNVGWSWSWVIDDLPGLCRLDVSAGDSSLPLAVTHVARRHPHAASDPVPRTSVPPVPKDVVAYVDAAGNVTTSIGEPPGPAGSRVDVRIGRVSARAIVCDRHAVPEGALALAAGAGWPRRRGGRRRFLELVLGGGSAAERFAGPEPGTAVRLSRRRQREL
jgi:hypothetical protein